jgi:hypothetical protein
VIGLGADGKLVGGVGGHLGGFQEGTQLLLFGCGDG